jgi:cytidylate kinase
VSAIPAVRAYLLEMQRSMAREHSVVMDGRDIGTVVLPDAGLKIFLTASVEARAKRRYAELQEKGSADSYEQVLQEMVVRDENDTNRAAAPLKAAEDAILVDTTACTLDESIQLVCDKIAQRFSL